RLGDVVAGARIDDHFARDLKGNGNDDIVISAKTILGSSVDDRHKSKFPWHTQQEWEQIAGKDPAARTVVVDGETFQAVGASLNEGDPNAPFVAVVQSYDDAMKPYSDIQRGLLVLGLIAAVAGVSISALLARNITTPVAKLVEGTQQVAAGNFDY